MKVITVAVVLLLSISIPTGALASGPPEDGANDDASYETHSYISLRSNTDLKNYVSTHSIPGAGTLPNPYVISGWEIEGTTSRFPVSLSNINLHLTIRDSYLHSKARIGVSLSQCSNFILENNTIEDISIWGVYVFGSSSISLVSNRLNDTGSAAMYVTDGSSISIKDNTCTNTTQGIKVTDSAHVTIDGNHVVGGNWPISITSCDQTIISNNYMKGRQDFRIGSSNMTISGNKLDGVYFFFSGGESFFDTLNFTDDHTIGDEPVLFIKDTKDERVTTNFSQMYVYNCTNISVDGVKNVNPFATLQTSKSSWVNITNCIFNDNMPGFQQSIRLFGEDCRIENSTINSKPLRIRGERILVRDCSIVGDTYALEVEASNSTIVGNTLGHGALQGINLGSYGTGSYGDIRNTSILNNTIVVDPTYYRSICINFIKDAMEITVSGNKMTGGGIVFSEARGPEYADLWGSHTITPDNTVNGRPVFYLGNARGKDVTGDWGQVIIGNSTDIAIHGMTFEDEWAPLQCGLLEDSAIHNNTFKSCDNYPFSTLSLTGSRGTDVYENNFLYSSMLTVRYCQEVLLARNYLTGESNISILDSGNITAVTNHVRSVNEGFVVMDSTDIDISNNLVEESYDEGVYVGGTSANVTVHHNNFVNDNKTGAGVVVSPLCGMGANAEASWDDGLEGNYWSDYMIRYPTATNDGTTWDTPYDIRGPYDDDHPLVGMWDTTAPNAVVEESVFYIDQGGTVTFNASRSSDDIGVTNISWSFSYEGEDKVLYGAVNSFTFDHAGRQTIVLRVFDAAGNFDHLRVYVHIRDIVPPIADAGLDITTDQGQLVSFDGTGSTDNLGIAHYNWTFTYNGSTVLLKGARPSFVFDIPGLYNVTLNVSDGAGLSDEAYVLVLVRDTMSPVAVAPEDMEVDQGTNVTFDGTGSSDNVAVVTYIWEFTYEGLPVKLYGNMTSFTFDLAGLYYVTLTVGDAAGNAAFDLFNLTVRDTETPVADAGEDINVDMGSEVLLDASASRDNLGITNYTWTFVSDGSPMTLYGRKVSFVFDLAGIYDVSLNVTDAAGHWSTVSIIVTVRDTELPLAAAGDDITVDQNTTVLLDGSGSTDNVGIVEYSWSLSYEGAPVLLTGQSAEFTYDLPGVYIVVLMVVDAEENEATDYLTVTVRDTQPPVPVSETLLRADMGDTVIFDATGTTDNGGIASITWTFEYDGNTRTLTGIQVGWTFADDGLYDVILNVTDLAGNSAELPITLVVRNPDAPIADAGEDQEVPVGTEVTFDASGSTDNVAVTSWTWKVEYDGTTQTLVGQTVRFTFDLLGVYTVQLTVMDADRYKDVDEIVVTVIEATAPIADAGEDVTVEAGDEHTFDASGTTSVQAIETYTWTFHYDGQDVTLEGVAPTFTFVAPGLYEVTLTAVDNTGYPDADTLTITVVDTTPPNAEFSTIVPPRVGDNEFFDGSDSTDNVGVVNWSWKFTFENEITHLYGEQVWFGYDREGEYLVELTVHDAAGNEDATDITVTAEEAVDDEPLPLFWMILVAAVIGAVVLAVIFIFVLKGRSKPPEGV